MAITRDTKIFLISQPDFSILILWDIASIPCTVNHSLLKVLYHLDFWHTLCYLFSSLLLVSYYSWVVPSTFMGVDNFQIYHSSSETLAWVSESHPMAYYIFSPGYCTRTLTSVHQAELHLPLTSKLEGNIPQFSGDDSCHVLSVPSWKLDINLNSILLF